MFWEEISVLNKRIVKTGLSKRLKTQQHYNQVLRREREACLTRQYKGNQTSLYEIIGLTLLAVASILLRQYASIHVTMLLSVWRALCDFQPEVRLLPCLEWSYDLFFVTTTPQS